MDVEFEVRPQNRLSLEKCFGLVLSGIQFRLFRSAVTVVVIALAVAFLVTMLTDGFVGQKVADAVDERSMPRKVFLFWVDRLSVNIAESEVARTLISSTPGDNRWEEMKSWGKLDDATLAGLAEVARQEQMYLDWFTALPEGVKRPLVGRAMGREILELLLAEKEQSRFVETMPKTGKQMPTSLDDFRRFLTDWSNTRAARAAIMASLTSARPAAKRLMRPSF